MKPVEWIEGDGPIILTQPHCGTCVPEGMFEKLTPQGQHLGDTDWHIDKLYDGLLPGATVIRAPFNRYVIDANRAPTDASLYPGQNTTSLVPKTDFQGAQIWRESPHPDEVARRRELYHKAYHHRVRAEVERVKQRHGLVLIYDCHSIHSRRPFLFDGKLSDLNIGTNSGASCADAFAAVIESACDQSKQFSWVRDGRFRGGWTTRHYGQPHENVHAVQMEVAQSAYLKDENGNPPLYDAEAAAPLRSLLKTILAALERRALMIM
ncbi:MAG: N-formylglutamate deformylase [Pseudomonadota bacterium]